ncbi:TetR family transcriptional regulator [Streptomyces sp. TLI_235]|nr:TetR/AcrR family transcriptional regulator [Streptomyces sp. TLI_235]PBC77034.1 TetR family transcriptional regulator [Streptomyces sp. TLI_235]
MTASQLPAPQRSHARSNRARILATAREELGRNADATLDELARAAGVARRTLFGHFPNRQALIAALAEEATQSIEEAVDTARRPGDDAATAMVRMTLAMWTVGDRYRMLISLARRDIGEEGVRAALEPARTEATANIRRGQQDGVFADVLPAPVLSRALEALTLALIEEQDSPDWTSPSGEAAAVALLLASGVSRPEARELVRSILDGGDRAE